MSATIATHRDFSAGEKRVIFASSLGTVFEWYDFYLYAVLAPFFAALFFPPGNQTAALLSHAIVDALTRLGHDGARRLTRLRALLDLLEIERLHVPFDAQTRFYDAFLADGRLPPDDEIAGLATRLGFA